MRLVYLPVLLILDACSSTNVPEPAGENPTADTVDFTYTHPPGTTPNIAWAKTDASADEIDYTVTYQCLR